MSTVPPNEAKQNCIEPSVERGPDATHDARAKQARPTTAADQAVKAAADDEALVSPAASLSEQLKSEVIEIPLHDLFVEYANGRWIRGSYLIVTDRGTKATVRVSVDTLLQYATERSTIINPKVQAAFDKMMRAKRIRRPSRRPAFTVEDLEKAQQDSREPSSEGFLGRRSLERSGRNACCPFAKRHGPNASECALLVQG